MRLFVVTSTAATEVSEITLGDGCIPTICGQHHHGSSVNKKDCLLEPAIWFKVMVLDAITVDCFNRCISRSAYSGKIGEAGNESSQNISESVHYVGEDFCEYDHDLDDVFDSLPILLSDLKKNAISTSQFQDSVMRLLHLFILPSIKLGIEDVAALTDQMQAHEKLLEKIDAEIMAISEKVQSLEQSKTNQRHNFVEEICSSEERHRYRKPFVKLLHDDVVSEISRMWSDLNAIQDEVELAKQTVDRHKDKLLIPNESRKKAQELLDTKRQTRDEISLKYNQLIMAREKLVEMKRNRTETVTQKIMNQIVRPTEDNNTLCKIYMALNVNKINMVEKCRMLTDKKLLLLSVKESMKSTLSELTSGHESFGVDADSTGVNKATDVLGRLSMSERSSWQSIAEQVAEVIGKTSHPVGMKHRKFCSEIAERCEAAVSEKSWYDRQFSDSTKVGTNNNEDIRCSNRSETFSILSSMQCSSDSGSSSSSMGGNFNPVDPVDKVQSRNNHIVKASSKEKRKQSSLQYETSQFYAFNDGTVIDDAVIVFEQDKNYVQKAIERIKTDISAHFDIVCKGLQTELQRMTERYYRKIWLHYESHFYQETMDYLTQLYKLQYENITEVLCISVKNLTAKDLGLEDVKLAQMLQDVEQVNKSSTTCSHSEETSKVSDIKQQFQIRKKTRSFYSSSVKAKKKDSQWQADVIDGDEGIMRRHGSPVTRRPKTMRQSMCGKYPKSVAIVYDRMLGTVTEQDSMKTFDELDSESQHSGTNQPGTRSGGELRQTINEELTTRRAKSMKMKPKYRAMFASAFEYLESAASTRCPSSKLQLLTKCLRETSLQIDNLHRELYGSPMNACCDELMDALVILLCNVDGPLLARLYCQIMFLADIIPPFFRSGQFSFTLVQFVGSCTFIQEQTVLKRNRSEA